MAKRDTYEPGTFCSVDLATPDREGAKSFYGSLFGWDAEDVPADGTTYTILRVDGDAVAGCFDQPADQREAGIPPNWISYVSVEDADATAAEAGELGGQVLQEPFDLMDVGRMAVLQDPTGGVLAAWQPGTHAGVARVNEPGCLTWNELATNDPAGALAFYSGLLGWGSQVMEAAGGPPYTIITVGERSNGGIRPLSPEEEEAGVPPHWIPYFDVESVEATIERSGELGGAKLFGPMDFPAGRIAAVRDAQGAAFAIWEGEVQD